MYEITIRSHYFSFDVSQNNFGHYVFLCNMIVILLLVADKTSAVRMPKAKYKWKKTGNNTRGKNHFNVDWCERLDDNQDLVGEYITKASEFSVKCKWCVLEFSIGDMGWDAIKRHSKSKSHQNIANLRKNRVGSQAVFGNPTAAANADDASIDDPDPVDNVPEEHAGPSTSSANQKGILNFFTKSSASQVIVENNNNRNMTLNDKVSHAEIRILLQTVDKNYSLNSLDSLTETMKVAFPDSSIAAKISLGRHKGSYALTEAIGPYFLAETLRDIKNAEFYVLGLDTATTKHQGLSKGLDFKVRYYSEKRKKVMDVYISTANLGHENSAVLKDVTLKELNEAGLDVKKLLVISRDNPNVMRSYNNLLEEEVKKMGNPQMFQSPCTLHPTHTSFKKGLEELDFDADSFLISIHSWFKVSTARREDFTELRINLDLEDEKVYDFFLRHVSTRWLTMKHVAQRILDHFLSLTEYFLTYLPNSTEPSHKLAVKSDQYQKIVKILKPAVNAANFARLKFIVYLSTKTETFLKTFQSEKPLGYKLHTDCCLLIANLMTSVVDGEYVPKTCDGKKFLKVDCEAERKKKKPSKTLPALASKKCDFGPVVDAAVAKCKIEDQQILKLEFKNAMITMINYLVDHLPLDSKFLKDLSFSNPTMIESTDFAPALIRVAEATKRFSDTEIQSLNTQLIVLKMCENLPKYDDTKDTFDEHWLNKLVPKVKERIGEGDELCKLIKIISIFPNSQGFVERGFNDTKRIADSRQSVSEDLMKASKAILDVVRNAGGPDKVFIGLDLIGAHQSARATYHERLRREEKERASMKALEKIEEKKRKFELDKEAWDEKVKSLRGEIKVLKKTVTKHEEDQTNYFDSADKAKSEIQKSANFKLARVAAENIKNLRKELDSKQEDLSRLMSKKPKLVE